MAFLIKNDKATQAQGGYAPTVSQFAKTSKASATVPATTTQNIFTVGGGRVLVRALIGEVTTAIQNQACNLKVTLTPTTGTATDLAANVAIANDEAGTLYSVEGDETALLENSSGFISVAPSGGFACAPGVINIETSATNTGATKWDIYWLPLDKGAYVISA